MPRTAATDWPEKKGRPACHVATHTLVLARTHSVPSMQQTYSSSSLSRVPQPSLQLELWQVTANQRYWQHKAGRPWGGVELLGPMGGKGEACPHPTIYLVSSPDPQPPNRIFIIDLWNPNFPSISCRTLILRPDRKRRLKANLYPTTCPSSPHLVPV